MKVLWRAFADVTQCIHNDVQHIIRGNLRAHIRVTSRELKIKILAVKSNFKVGALHDFLIAFTRYSAAGNVVLKYRHIGPFFRPIPIPENRPICR
jgi:hypothetical protein